MDWPTAVVSCVYMVCVTAGVVVLIRSVTFLLFSRNVGGANADMKL